MDPNSNQPQLEGLLQPPLSIEFRFSNAEKYIKMVRLYCTLLVLPQPELIPETGEAQPYYSYAIGPEEYKIELRFVLLKGKNIEHNSTLVYWQVESDTLDKVYDKLCQSTDYKSVEPPADVVGTPTSQQDKVRRSVLQDTSGNLLGLIDIDHVLFPIGRRLPVS